MGIQTIKHNAGITFAQEPSIARFPSMPRGAIETECVDFVLRPAQMAREIVRLGISTLRDRVCMTAAMLVLAPIFEADLPPEQYVYRQGRNAQQAVREVEETPSPPSARLV